MNTLSWHKRVFGVASRTVALVAILGLFLSALLPNTVPTVKRRVNADPPAVSPQPEDVSLVSFFEALLLPAPVQLELEEELESGEETEKRKFKAVPASHGGLCHLSFRLLNTKNRRPDSQRVPTGSQAPDPRPPRA